LAGTLRTLFLAFTQSPEGIPRSKDELVEALTPHVEDPTLAKIIANVEATQTFRHSYIYALGKRPDSRELANILSAIDPGAPFCVNDKSNLQYLGSCPNDYPLLRLAHPVTNTYYVPETEGRLKPETSSFRHAVVIAIKPELGIVEIRFNGYEQSKFTSEADRISYREIAEHCKAFLIAGFGLDIQALQLKQPIEELLSKYSDEVIQSKNVSRVGRGGRISLDVGDTDDVVDITTLLRQANLLKKDDESPTAAIESWTAENVTLTWLKYKALTRIDYMGETPEILFSWKAVEHRSLWNHDSIIKRMVTFADLENSQVVRNLEAVVSNMSAKDILTVLDISQAANVPLSGALEYLMQMVESKRLGMFFRVKTDQQLLDMYNNWVASLGALPREVETIHGQKIDLMDPRNVEVGFSTARAQ
jgi:hypothetical protein